MNRKRTNLDNLRLGYCILVMLICIISGSYFLSDSKAQNAVVSEKQPNQTSDDLDAAFVKLIEIAREKGSVRVIIGLRMDFTPVGYLDETQRERQQRNIKQNQDNLLESLAGYNVREVKQFQYIPVLGAEVDVEALEKMRQDPLVVALQEDKPEEPTLAESVPLVGAPAAWTLGFTGSGWAVAVLDTGVDKNHPFLTGKVISEACYSSNNAGQSVSVCPGGVTSSTASNSGLHCSLTVAGCNHGTHVAGIAAGTGPSFHGVARGGNLIAIQVFSRFDNQANCGTATAPCALTYPTDQIAGLERVLTLSGSTNIAAANMSLGGGQFTSNCDTDIRKLAIDNLRSVGVATVIASGNSGFINALGAPACISTAVSVGSTGDGSSGATVNVVSSFSNSASILNLLAPGQWITSSVPGTGFSTIAGTSMAAPHVAGGWAVLKQKKPTATVTEILTAFTSTGLLITDTRNGIVKPRIRVDSALAAIDPPICTSSPITIGQTINGSLTTSDCIISGRYYDAYTFSGTAGQQIAILQSSTAFDTYLYLLNSSGVIIAEDDDGGGGTNSRIPATSGFFTLPTTGTYTIRASSFLTGATGAYSVNLTGAANAGTVQFSSSSYNVNENGGSATITVTRTGGTSAFSVNFATSNGTAIAGSDYAATSGTLNFAANENSKTFNVTILDDLLVEGNETVNLALSSPTGGATIGSPSTAVLTIIDNDAACSYSINPTSQNFGQSGGSGSVQVTTQAGCNWTAVSNSLTDFSIGNLSQDYNLPVLPQIEFGKSSAASNDLMTPAFSEGFENIGTLPGSGWFTQNNSVPAGSTGWFQGNSTVFPAQAGTATSYIGANFNNTTGTNTISNWLLTPNITFNNGDVIRFWTRTTTANPFPDRLQVRLSTNGTSTNVGTGAAGVGDFTALLLDINPTYQTGGVYPEVWTQYTITISGLGGATSGRMAFRYFTENGGPTGANSNYIGIDTFSYTPATTSGWITINPPSSGTGSGTVNYSVATNTTGSPRTGTMTIAGQTFTVNQSSGPVTNTRKQFDFDGDNKSDVAIYRPSNGQWWINRSSNGSTFAVTFGTSTDRIAPADFTGDGKTDIAFFRPSSGQWFVLRSENFTFYAFAFGTNGDVPAPGFFDADNQADVAVFRPSNATWYIRRSTDGGFTIQQFGANGDIPVVGNYDGDNRDDVAIFRPSTGVWWIYRSASSSVVAYQFGTGTDKPVIGDFTGDGKADATIWRPSTGEWFVLRSENLTFFAAPFGTNGDVPLSGDFDGDNLNDFAVFRPSNNVWYVNRTTGGTMTMGFGTSGDKPVPSAFIP